MADVFSNLTEQSLNSGMGIQPLVAPLFAPALPILSDATPLPPGDRPASVAEVPPFSISPATFAGEMTDTLDIERSSEATTSPEKRPVLSDLVPFDVPKHTNSTVSLRRLLQPQPRANDKMEAVSPVSQASVLVPTVDESRPEDTRLLAFSTTPLPDSPSEAGASHPVQHNQPVPVSSQETTSPNAVPAAPETLLSSTSHDNQKLPAKNSFHAEPVKPEPQTIPSVGHSEELVEDVSFPLQPSSIEQSPFIAPQASQSLLPTVQPSPKPTSQPEHSMHPDATSDQQPLSLTQPPTQETPIPPRRGRLIAPIADLSALAPTTDASAPKPTRQPPEVPPQPLLKTADTAIEPLSDQPAHHIRKDERDEEEVSELLRDAVTTIRPIADPVSSDTMQPLVEPATMPAQNTNTPVATRTSEENVDASIVRGGRLITPGVSVPAAGPSIAPDAQVSSRISPKQEAQAVKEEVEAAPIRITIGRVVVRATPAIQSAPIQKRIPRPAQSLSDYLKQRERGSR
ncbi:MAG TPA: hypothetical protein VJ761_22010 [Ktedonobacteraceae bacterium]|nr:hypothetical protein [Ktedonobacteraceae bacterium]